MGEQFEPKDKAETFDSDDMMGGEPKDINAKSDNDRLAGIIPDPRIPVPPTGGSTDYSEDRNAPADEG